MTDKLVEILQRHSCAMEPIPTGVTPKLTSLAGVRAVMFDVYGTMLISGSGDVGTIAAAPGHAFSQACATVGLTLRVPGDEAAKQLVNVIKSVQEESRSRGIRYPEVDILAVWRQTLANLCKQGDLDTGTEDVERMAIEYEVRANPVWKMPGLKRCLDRLVRADLQLGIISNAQFFTPLLFPAVLQQTLPELGFRVDLCFYSFEHGCAKPDLFLYEMARKSLDGRGISADQVLYVGNDMLNDVMPAQAVGFKTALFAGDGRSLRLREDDDRVAGAQANVVITELDQLLDVLMINNS